MSAGCVIVEGSVALPQLVDVDSFAVMAEIVLSDIAGIEDCFGLQFVCIAKEEGGRRIANSYLCFET